MSGTLKQRIFCMKTYYEKKKRLSSLSKQDTDRSSISTLFHNFKLVKNFEARDTCENLKTTSSSPSGVPITNTQEECAQTPRKNVYLLSITLHAAFNSA